MVGVFEITTPGIGGQIYSDLKNVRAAESFRMRTGYANRTSADNPTDLLLAGEEKNLNGVRDAGEDDAMYGGLNNRLNSPVEAGTLVANYTSG